MAEIQAPDTTNNTAGVSTLAAPDVQDTGKATIGDLQSAQALASLMPSRPPAAPPTAAPATPAAHPAGSPAGSPADSLTGSADTHGQKIAKGANAVAEGDPKAAAQPGGWARALLGGALTALGGVANIATGGALTPLVAAAKPNSQAKQRQFQNVQEADKNKALNAEANSRMYYQQALTHKLGDEAVQASVTSGKEQIAAMKNQPNPGIELNKGWTDDDAKKALQDGTFNPVEETLIPSGVLSTKDKDGQPYSQVTFSKMKTTPADLDPKDPDQKKTLDRLNKWNPPEVKKTWQGDANGIVHFSGPQYNMALQIANERETADIAVKKAADNLGVARDQLKEGEEASKFKKDPILQKALSDATTSGVPDYVSAANALRQASQNPKSPLYNKYTNIDNDMREYLPYSVGAKGEKVYLYDKMLEDYQKKADTAITNNSDLLKKTTESHGEESASIAETWQAKADATNDPALKKQYLGYRDLANKQANATVQYDAKKKLQESDSESKISDGDMDDLIDMAKKYETDPDKLFSSRMLKGQKQKGEFEARIHREDSTWSEATYRSRYNTKNDFRPQGKGGLAKADLNTFALHTGDASNLVETLRNTGSPLLNTPLNKFKQGVLGQPQFLAYRTAVSAAAENYINFLLSNKAKHSSDDELAAQLKSDTISPAMAQGMMRQMATTIAAKAREFNKNYKDEMKEDIPSLLDPNTVGIFKKFGIDPSTEIMSTQKNLIPTNGDPAQGAQGAQGAPAVPVGGRPIMKGGKTVGYVDQNNSRVNF